MLGTRRPRDLQNAVKPTLADAAGSGGEVASALWPWSSDGSFARCMVGYGVAATGDVRRCKHGMLRKQKLSRVIPAGKTTGGVKCHGSAW